MWVHEYKINVQGDLRYRYWSEQVRLLIFETVANFQSAFLWITRSIETDVKENIYYIFVKETAKEEKRKKKRIGKFIQQRYNLLGCGIRSILSSHSFVTSGYLLWQPCGRLLSRWAKTPTGNTDTQKLFWAIYQKIRVSEREK